MPTLTVDFQQVKLLPITEGIEFFGGWLHTMLFTAQLPTVLVGDNVFVSGRVPVDEDWQVLGLSNDDFSATPLQQGWKQQRLAVFLPFASILGTAGAPSPTGQMVGASQFFKVWGRLWDGGTYLQWGDLVGGDLNSLILRPCDPTWSVHRWPAAMLWRLESYEAALVGGGSMGINLIVLRMPRGAQGVDVRRPLTMLNAALKALQESARREVLRG